MKSPVKSPFTMIILKRRIKKNPTNPEFISYVISSFSALDRKLAIY